MTLSVHHVRIAVHDADAVAATYRAAGFAEAGAHDGLRWLAGPNAFVALEQAAAPPDAAAAARRASDAGIAHLCLQSGDATGLWRTLGAVGVRFNADPAGLGTGYLYAYGRDREHNLIETEGVRDADPAVPPWLAHVAVVTPDITRARDFYERLFGRKPHGGGRFANPRFETITGLKDVDVEAAWIMADNLVFELWQYFNPPTSAGATGPTGYRQIGLTCDTLDVELARLSRAGIAASGRAPLLEQRAADVVDPDGNALVVFEAPQTPHPLALTELHDPDVVANRHRDVM